MPFLGKLQRSYVSELDQFLQELEQLQEVKSDSKVQEKKKYDKIFDLRDNAKSVSVRLIDDC